MRRKDEEVRLCKGVLRIQAAFKEIIEAASVKDGRPPRTTRSRGGEAGSARRNSRLPEDPVARRSWEIAGALDFAFPEMEEASSRRPATPEEIAASIERALPEDVSFGSSRGGPPKDADVFVIAYDFELRCLLNMNQGQVNPQWIPTSILWSLEDRKEKN